VIHCQWELASPDIESAKRALGVGEQEYYPALQLHDVSHAAHDQAGSHPSFSVEVPLAAENWFVRSCSPDHAYLAELVLKREDGSFLVMARSGPVQTPPSAPSDCVDERWAPIRLQARKPEGATPARPPSDLALQLSSGPATEPTTAPLRLPIDMREEVRSKLAALYGRPEPEAPAPLPAAPRRALKPQIPMATLADPPRLPIDMRKEVKDLLTQLYGEIGGESWVIPEPHLAGERPPAKGVFGEILASFAARPGVTTDLTEINERSFTSGISSRTT
jgi:Domain of unknown function (DUF4912)